MPRKKQNSPNLSHKSSLNATSDFCDFQGLEAHERSSEDELDSDVEDAIYAKMYFTTSNALHASQQEVTQSRPEMHDSQGRYVVLSLDPSSSSSSSSSLPQEGTDVPNEAQVKKNKKESGENPPATRKRKKKKKKKKGVTHSTDDSGVGTMDSTDASVGDSGIINIDVDEGVASTAGEVKKSPRLTSTNKDVAGKRKIQLKKKEKEVVSPEEDIKKLFATPKKPNMVIDLTLEDNAFVDLTNCSSENDDKGTEDMVLCSSNSQSSSSSRSSSKCSMESGELEGSGTPSSGGGGDDPWKIIEKDRLGRDAYDRFYGDDDSYGRYYGKQNTKCGNCKQKGHSSQTCPWPKRNTVCYLCAGLKHLSSNCPKNLCNYCYRAKHRGQGCWVPGVGMNTVCNRCYMKGHHDSACPDSWRQFHHTTYESNHLVTISGDLQRRSHNIYCSNCSSHGHFGFECTRSCPRGNPAHHLPLIAIYTANWPPRDDYSLSIIAISRAKGHSEKSPTKGNDQSPGENEEERGVGKRKLSFSEEEEEEGREDSLSHPPKRKKKKKQNSRKDKRKYSLADEDEREGTSLLVTVDSGGSRATSSSNKRGSLSSSRDLDRSGPSALLVTPSPAYTSRPRPLIKSTPVTPLSAGNYPRESFNDSSYHHSNHHPSHRGDPYRSDRNASYTPTTTFIPPIMTNHQRTLSVDNDHRPRPPPLMNRRHSDYDRYYTPPGLHQPRGQYLEADRGFRISEQTARQVGYYRKDSNEPQRHWETGQNRYDSRRRPPRF